MTLCITCQLGDRDQKNGLPVGGLRIAVDGERVHRFDPETRPIEAKQEWGPKYVGIYPAMDFALLLNTVKEVVEQPPDRRQQEVSLCECGFEFVFDRLDDTYVRLAVQTTYPDTKVVPVALRGYLVGIDSLAEELVAAVDGFLGKVTNREVSDVEELSALQAERDAFDEEILG